MTRDRPEGDPSLHLEVAGQGSVTQHHRLGDLEQQKFVLSQFGDRESDIKGWAGPPPSQALGQGPSGPFQLPGAPGAPRLCRPLSLPLPHTAVFPLSVSPARCPNLLSLVKKATSPEPSMTSS